MTTLREILDEWQKNIKFRKALKDNPRQALKDLGFQVSDEDYAKLESTIKAQNEKLDDRINK
jgi:hypothetical protein